MIICIKVNQIISVNTDMSSTIYRKISINMKSIWSKHPNKLKLLGLRIKEMRKKKYKKAVDAARAAGFSQSNWAEIETGKAKLTVEKIYDLAEFLDCSPKFLMFGKNRENGKLGDDKKDIEELTNQLLIDVKRHEKLILRIKDMVDK